MRKTTGDSPCCEFTAHDFGFLSEVYQHFLPVDPEYFNEGLLDLV